MRGRMPTLEMINERFARYTRISMFNLLRRSADVSVGGVQVMKFGEYVHSLYVPTSLNLVKMKPLRGTALFILDAKLVFAAGGQFLSEVTGATPRSRAASSPRPSCASCAWCWIRPLPI